MLFDCCIIGHVTRDRIVVDDRSVRNQPGGTPYYAGLAAVRLGLRTALVTKLHPRDHALLLADLEAENVVVRALSSSETTEFVNRYQSNDVDDRDQKVGTVADPFQPEELDVEAKVYLFGPLTQTDLAPGCIRRASEKGHTVALDVQGLLRHIRDERVELRPSVEALRVLEWVDVVKASVDEAMLLTGAQTVEAAAYALAAAGAREVLVTAGGAGSHVLADGRLHTIGAYAPSEVVDTTGCGDTYLAAYLAHRLHGAAPPRAGDFASRVAGAKTGRFGAYAGGLQTIQPVSQESLNAVTASRYA